MQHNGTKQQLLDISKGLFNEKGFDQVTVDEICRKAGVTKGAFYHHFSSKLDIPIAQYRAIQNEFYTDYEEHFHLGHAQRLERAILWYAGYCTDDKVNIISNYHRVLMSSAKNRMLRRIEIETKVFGEIIASGMRAGAFSEQRNPDFLSQMISRFIASLLLDWAVFKGDVDLATDLGYLCKNIMALLGAEREQPPC